MHLIAVLQFGCHVLNLFLGVHIVESVLSGHPQGIAECLLLTALHRLHKIHTKHNDMPVYITFDH